MTTTKEPATKEYGPQQFSTLERVADSRNSDNSRELGGHRIVPIPCAVPDNRLETLANRRLNHRNSQLDEFVSIRKQRIVQLRKLIEQFDAIESATIAEMSDMLDMKNSQIQILEDVTDQLAHELHQQSEELKATAQELVGSATRQLWETNPCRSLVKEVADRLSRGRQLCESLERRSDGPKRTKP